MDEVVKQLAQINTNLNSISINLSDPSARIGTIISLISVLIALFAAWQSKIAAQETLKARIGEVQPVLKNSVFQYDSVKKDIIVNIQCKGRGTMYNLIMVKPDKKDITYRVEIDTNLRDDFRINPIIDGKVEFEYEDVFGNKYKSTAKVSKNSLIGDYKQSKT